MSKRILRNLLILIPFSALFAACTTSGIERPTHRWQATEAKTERQYQRDNYACHEQFGLEKSAPMPAETPSFEAYRNCMVDRGYVLQSYL